MAALQKALKSLGPVDYSTLPIDDLKSYLSDSFHHAQLLVDSVPSPPSNGDTVTPSSISSSHSRLRSVSTASNASEMSISDARSDPPPSEVEALQKDWGKPIKLNAKDNPLGMTVYKASGKDGKGAWFARRSVHEGLSFTKWKKSLEREFPETLKVQGSPGEGNIRGIGGERRVEEYEVDNVGKLEVYHLNAQFPGPTAPRDFVQMILTSDTALSEWSTQDSQPDTGDNDLPRHFMVVSKPCNHPECPPRDGFVRGQYESVEFIREVPLIKPQSKSASTTNLPLNLGRERSSSTNLSKEAILRNASKKDLSQGLDTDLDGGRPRGKTISFAESRGSSAKGEGFDIPRDEVDESDSNPVEWIMITRSDPGGGLPRFMVERGTPGAIVADASKFLNWACSNDLEDMIEEERSGTASPEEERRDHHSHRHSRDLPDYQTNGHLAGINGKNDTKEAVLSAPSESAPSQTGIYEAVAGAVGAAGAAVAAYTPETIAHYIPGYHSSQSTTPKSTTPESSTDNSNSTESEQQPRRSSIGSKSAHTIDSFVSALSGNESSEAISTGTGTPDSPSVNRADSQKQKELQKLEERKRKLDEKLAKTREKELSRKTEDVDKEQIALAKAEEKHQKEVAKQEEKYKKEVAKLEAKKEREKQKAEEKRRKAEEKDERTRLARELEEARAQIEVLKVEKEILETQVGSLQSQNTVLTARIGQMGPVGEELLKDVELSSTSTGRLRAASILSSRTSLETRSKDNIALS